MCQVKEKAYTCLSTLLTYSDDILSDIIDDLGEGKPFDEYVLEEPERELLIGSLHLIKYLKRINKIELS